MKQITRDQIFSFDEMAEQQLRTLLDREDANERDDILPFFRLHPLPMVVAVGGLTDFATIHYEPELGNRFRADFVSQTFSSMGGTCFFYELEQHRFSYFTKRGKDLSSQFAHTLTQILEWKTYYEMNREEIHQKYGVVGPHGEETPPTFVIIMGRRDQLVDSIKAEYSRLEGLFDRVHIMTYDRVLQACAVARSLSIGYKTKGSVITKRFRS